MAENSRSTFIQRHLNELTEGTSIVNELVVGLCSKWLITPHERDVLVISFHIFIPSKRLRSLDLHSKLKSFS